RLGIEGIVMRGSYRNMSTVNTLRNCAAFVIGAERHYINIIHGAAQAIQWAKQRYAVFSNSEAHTGVGHLSQYRCARAKIDIRLAANIGEANHFFFSRCSHGQYRLKSFAPSTNMHGVTKRVSRVAKVCTPAVALNNCVHLCVEGASKPRLGSSRFTLTPRTIGINPRIVVTAVSKTGRRRKQPVSKAAS